MHSPVTPNGGSIVRSPTPGPVMFVDAWFRDTNGNPIVGAEVDIWHSSPEGFYENQDPVQADMNLRGKFFTDADGHISFRSVKPAGYPIPIDGPTGDLLRAQGRHNMRPAHLHFLASKDGFKTLISQLYVPDDKFIETDVQFGVTRHLIGNYIRHENEAAPAPDVKGPGYSLAHSFVMETGRTKLPRPPITGKAAGERPKIPHLACGARRSRVPAKRAPVFLARTQSCARARAGTQGANQNTLGCRLALGPGSRFARPGHEIRVRHLAPAAARSTDAAVWPNRMARSSGVRMPPALGLTAFAFS
jgi:protocatechuate 3,4-dioxygenase beta subunit